jgi:hypothetical protein
LSAGAAVPKTGLWGGGGGGANQAGRDNPRFGPASWFDLCVPGEGTAESMFLASYWTRASGPGEGLLLLSTYYVWPAAWRMRRYAVVALGGGSGSGGWLVGLYDLLSFSSPLIFSLFSFSVFFACTDLSDLPP